MKLYNTFFPTVNVPPPPSDTMERLVRSVRLPVFNSARLPDLVDVCPANNTVDELSKLAKIIQ